MSKFKVGDRVLLREASRFYEEGYLDVANPLGILGTIEKVKVKGGLPIQVKWNNGELNAYTEIDLDKATIPDSKLARNLYKNRIKKIEGGLIYLK
jgi:hypothetical protein